MLCGDFCLWSFFGTHSAQNEHRKQACCNAVHGIVAPTYSQIVDCSVGRWLGSKNIENESAKLLPTYMGSRFACGLCQMFSEQRQGGCYSQVASSQIYTNLRKSQLTRKVTKSKSFQLFWASCCVEHRSRHFPKRKHVQPFGQMCCVFCCAMIVSRAPFLANNPHANVENHGTSFTETSL